MQIFVRHPSTNKTMLFDCSPNTTIQAFQEWVQDMTKWPPNAYFITCGGKYIATNPAEKTFAELNIEKDASLYLLGRMNRTTC
jgi:hypothetical protein